MVNEKIHLLLHIIFYKSKVIVKYFFILAAFFRFSKHGPPYRKNACRGKRKQTKRRIRESRTGFRGSFVSFCMRISRIGQLETSSFCITILTYSIPPSLYSASFTLPFRLSVLTTVLRLTS